jgi:hypothetical protein
MIHEARVYCLFVTQCNKKAIRLFTLPLLVRTLMTY